MHAGMLDFFLYFLMQMHNLTVSNTVRDSNFTNLATSWLFVQSQTEIRKVGAEDWRQIRDPSPLI